MTVLIMFGGKSSEHDVSLVSASSVLRNIDREKYDVKMMGITKDGKWYYYTGDIDSIENNTWHSKDVEPAQISADFGSREILVFGETLRRIKIDVVFPVMHGKNGEDGTIQGLFALAGIPCVGCDMLSSAMCMDKQITNIMADYANILQAKWLSVLKENYTEEFRKKAVEYLGLPIFVKPANAGSSVGITKVKTEADFEKAMELAFANDRKVVLEQNITGREVECAVLGNENPVAGAVGEIVPCAEFYDYDAKYVSDSKLFVPAPITDSQRDEIRAAAVNIYKTLGCSGLSRVDFFLAEDGLYFNEINTIPGFTSISMYPKLFDAVGVPYTELISKLIEYAVARG